jgi:glycosyltransferase involved in cell wall biosynthesis
LAPQHSHIQSGVAEVSLAPIRILIVSENISMEMGGESGLPYYYAKLFLNRGAEVWLACHERTATSLLRGFPELEARIRFVRDTPMQKTLFRFSQMLPYRLGDMIVGQAIHLLSQIRLRKIAIELARAGSIDVVLEPAPITPKGISFMYDVGVPVVIGPLCGGMNFPRAFANMDSFVTRCLMAISRQLAQMANRLVPGKLKADVLLVANSMTEKALPRGCRGKVIQLFESGVDLDLWKPTPLAPRDKRDPVRFVFSGRFVDWKGVQFLVPAFAKAIATEPRCALDLIGGGELEGEIRAIIERHHLKESVRLHGWMSRLDAAHIIRKADVFVMPSLRECGGSAILEAMALGKPVIAIKWGGPADYVKASCGLLVDPDSQDRLINGLADAMVRLARAPELRRKLGEGGQRRVCEDNLDWNSKADRVLSILTEVVASR